MPAAWKRHRHRGCIDAQRASEWRKRGFFPVLNEQDPTPANNRAASLLYRMLELKQSHPAPTREEYDALDFSLGRTQTCAAGDDSTATPKGIRWAACRSGCRPWRLSIA